MHLVTGVFLLLDSFVDRAKKNRCMYICVYKYNYSIKCDSGKKYC